MGFWTRMLTVWLKMGSHFIKSILYCHRMDARHSVMTLYRVHIAPLEPVFTRNAARRIYRRLCNCDTHNRGMHSFDSDLANYRYSFITYANKKDCNDIKLMVLQEHTKVAERFWAKKLRPIYSEESHIGL